MPLPLRRPGPDRDGKPSPRATNFLVGRLLRGEPGRPAPHHPRVTAGAPWLVGAGGEPGRGLFGTSALVTGGETIGTRPDGPAVARRGRRSGPDPAAARSQWPRRSEEHTSE